VREREIDRDSVTREDDDCIKDVLVFSSSGVRSSIFRTAVE
jgi:hypothetical protein